MAFLSLTKPVYKGGVDLCTDIELTKIIYSLTQDTQVKIPQ